MSAAHLFESVYGNKPRWVGTYPTFQQTHTALKDLERSWPQRQYFIVNAEKDEQWSAPQLKFDDVPTEVESAVAAPRFGASKMPASTVESSVLLMVRDTIAGPRANGLDVSPAALSAARTLDNFINQEAKDLSDARYGTWPHRDGRANVDVDHIRDASGYALQRIEEDNATGITTRTNTTKES